MPVYFLPVRVEPVPEPWQGGYVHNVKVDKRVFKLSTALRAGIAMSTFANVRTAAHVHTDITAQLEQESVFTDPNSERRKKNHQSILTIILLT